MFSFAKKKTLKRFMNQNYGMSLKSRIEIQMDVKKKQGKKFNRCGKFL